MITKATLTRLAVTLLLAIPFAAKMHAGVVQGVSILNFYSEYNPDSRRATNIVNDNGHFGDYHVTAPAGNTWLTFSAAAGDVTNAYITFDLGTTNVVNSMRVWNYNESTTLNNRGIQRADISYSTDGVTFTTNSPNVTFTKAPGTFSAFSQTISLAGIATRYICIKVITNYGGDRVGLSEVQFMDNSLSPVVSRATRSYLGTNVTVKFAESMLATDALNPANYHIIVDGTNAATVLGATFNTYNDSVNLHTTPLSNLVYSLSATNIRDAASLSTIANTLIPITNQLVLWLKAGTGVTDDGFGNITQWNDQSGFGNNASPGANPMPTLVPAAVNGQPSIHFDGTQILEIPDNPSINIKRDLTIYLLMSVDNLVTTIHGPITKCNVNQPASFDIQIAATTGRPSLVRGNGFSSASFASPGAGLAVNQYYLLSVVMRGTNITHYLNGNFNNSGVHVAGIGDAGNPIRLGARADNATRLRGNLAEVMVFNGAVSDGDQSAIDNYLGAKYGIPIIPLAITSHPQNATRFVGQTATFAVSAVAGVPNIFYQWQSNNVNIANATNASYTTPSLTLAANGAAYRAVVRTSLNITNISNPGILTVLADTQAPTVYSATRKTGSATDVVVVFSEAVATAGATNLANYSLNNGVTINSAVVGSSSNQVILTTSGLAAGVTYLLSVQNVQDVFGNTMSPGSAQILPAGMSLWVRADSGVLTNSPGLVSEWADQTANLNHAQQYGGTLLQPTLVGGAMNGLPVLRFDGVSNWLQSASSPSLAITGDLTLFVAINFADFSAGRQIIGKTLINQPASYDYYVLNATTTRLVRGNGAASLAVAATTTPTAGVPHVMGVTMAGTTVTHYLDGAANGSAALSTAMADAGTGFRIGSRNDLLQLMKGDIAEVMVFNTALSASERQVVNNYLAKYFPFAFTLQPTNVSRVEGQTASFFVGASQGGAVFNYQWQRYGTNIIGATNAAYTTPLLSVADDNSTFQALVWLAGGPTNVSDTATLTVTADTFPPTVLAVGRKIWSLSEIVVFYSEAVTPITATNIANYLVDNGVSVISAAMGNVSNRVNLVTTGITNGGSYMITVQNVKDLYNNTIVTVAVPLGFYPFPVLWLKADTGVTADGGGVVSGWDDQSGFANHASQPFGPSFMPTLITNGFFNGRPSIHFDGNTYLVANASPSLGIAGDISIYAVAHFEDYAGFDGIFGKTTGNLPAPYDYYLNTGTGQPRFFRGNGLVSGFCPGTLTPSTTAAHIMSVGMQTNAFAHFLDGNLNGSGSVTVATADDPGTPLGIGTRGDLVTKMKGEFAEMLIFDSALSTADRVAMDNYLGVKYNILVGSLPVISISAPSGGNISLSWPTPNLSFSLEATPSLAPPTWNPVSAPVNSSGGTNTVTIGVTNALQFFRLHQQ